MRFFLFSSCDNFFFQVYLNTCEQEENKLIFYWNRLNYVHTMRNHEEDQLCKSINWRWSRWVACEVRLALSRKCSGWIYSPISTLHFVTGHWKCSVGCFHSKVFHTFHYVNYLAELCYCHFRRQQMMAWSFQRRMYCIVEFECRELV